jgi:GNAT superfamily N-acetyltransferase
MDVLPAFGCRGLGTRLLHHACDWAKQAGAKGSSFRPFLALVGMGRFTARTGSRISPGMNGPIGCGRSEKTRVDVDYAWKNACSWNFV